MTARGDNAVHENLHFGEGTGFDLDLSWHAISDVGLRRAVNQDSYVSKPPIFAVADGMGGHSAGEIASAAVVRRLAELGGPRIVTASDIEDALSDAVDDIELDAGESELGTGTTVTGLAFGDDPDQPVWQVFNIGDSRVYQYLGGELTQLTLDHSVVQHLLDTGSITPEEATYHPHANVITRAVGFNEAPLPDFTHLPLKAGQRLLICSDGLTKELTDVGIEHYLATSATAEDAAQALVQQSLENEGRDNVTVIVIDVHSVGDMRDTKDLGAVDPGSLSGIEDSRVDDVNDTHELPKL